MPLDAVRQFIEGADSFIVSTHVNPDGDGIGSAMAIKWALLKLGKRAEIIIDATPPDTFHFFANYSWLTPYAEGMERTARAGAAIIVDCPSAERTGRVARIVSGVRTLIIDHHISNERYGDVNYLDDSAASSAEMVYRIIKHLGVPLDSDCAEYIYSGVIVDTGRFRFSNTTPETLRTAAELVAAGAHPAKVSEGIFYSNTLETTRALGAFIGSIRLHHGGMVATAEFNYEYLRRPEYKLVNHEGFVNHALAIRGVEAAMFLREVERSVTRASLRSKSIVDVNALARSFGGGGHARAAGCTIETPLDQARAALLARVGEMLLKGDS